MLSFKKKEEDVHRCWQPQVVAHNLERPHERPVVGMELGGGDVELGKKLPFKASEGKPKFHLLELVVYMRQNNPPVFPLSSTHTGMPGEQGSTIIFSSCSCLLYTSDAADE